MRNQQIVERRVVTLAQIRDALPIRKK
jgi:hypothetical protein